MPIEGVPVDGFFCEGRHGRAFDVLTELLRRNEGTVTCPELVDAIMDANPDIEPSRAAIDTWVRRPASVEWLEQATGTTYTPGTSRSSPGVFHF